MGPGADYAVIRVLPDSMRVAVPGGKGYVHQSLIMLDDDADSPPAARTGKTTGNPNLRRGPGTEYPVLTVLRPGVPLTMLGSEDDYVHVRADRTEGYIHQDFVQLKSPRTNGAIAPVNRGRTEEQLAPPSA